MPFFRRSSFSIQPGYGCRDETFVSRSLGTAPQWVVKELGNSDDLYHVETWSLQALDVLNMDRILLLVDSHSESPSAWCVEHGDNSSPRE